MLTKENIYDLYRKFSKSGTSIVVVPYREIDEEAFNSKCWDAFDNIDKLVMSIVDFVKKK